MFFIQTLVAFLIFKNIKCECNETDRLQFDVLPFERTVKLFDHFELECDITSKEHPVVTWKLNDVVVQETNLTSERKDENEFLWIKTKLFVPCADKDTVGKYRCFASTNCKTIETNPVNVYIAPKRFSRSNPTSLWYSDQKCLPNTQTPPVIVAWTDARLATVHEDVVLICRAVGNPTSIITWYKIDENEKRISLTDEILLKNGDLFVPKHTVAHQLPSIYECVARNEIGIDAKYVMYFSG